MRRQKHQPASEPGAEFLLALNAAAASLQRSAHSEAEVFRAFREQIARLGLSGGLVTLDEAGERLVVRSVAYPEPLLNIMEGMEKFSGLEIEGFAFPATQVEAYRQVLESGEARLLPKSGVVITQLLPSTAQHLAGPLLQAMGSLPALFAPLVIEGKPQGVFSVIGAGLSEADLPPMQAFANHIAVALENARAQTALRQSEERYRTLFANALNGFALHEIVTDSQGKPVDYVFLEVNPAFERLTGLSAEQVIGRRVTEVLPGIENDPFIEIYGRVALTGEPAHFEQFATPLNRSYDIAAFSQRHGQFAVTFADITQRKRTEAALQRRADELAALQATLLDLTAQHALPVLLNAIVERAAQLLNAPGGGLYLCDPDRREVRCVVSYNTPRDYTGVVLKYGEGAAGVVAQTGAPLIIDDYRAWSGRGAVFEDEQPFTAVLSVPLLWQQRVIGVIHVLHDRAARHFTSDDLNLLTLFANHAAIAVENARLFQEAERELDERKQAEDALQESRQLLEKTFASLDQAIFVVNPATRTVTHCNPATERMFGYRREEVVGHNTRFLHVDRERYEEFGRALFAALDQGRVFRTEFQMKRKDGTIFNTENTVTEMVDESGHRTGVVSVVRDITERKQAEEAQRLQSAALEAAANAIVITDRDGNIQWVNPAFTALTGYTSAEAIGRNPRDLVRSGAHNQAFYKDLWETILAGQVWRGEMINRCKDGRLYTEEQTITPLRGARGEAIAHFIAIRQDITERKRAEEATRKQLAELDALHKVSSTLRAAETADQALPVLLDQTLAVLGTEAGIIYLYNPASGDLRTAVARSWFQNLSEALIKPGEGIAGTVFHSGQPHFSHELARDPLSYPLSKAQTPPGWGGACVPIRSTTGTVGVIFVSVPLPREISPEEMSLLDSLAEMAGTALHRMRLHEETARQLDQLQALHRIDQAIAASLDLRMTLSIILNQVTGQLNVDAAGVLLLNPHTQTLTYEAGHGFRTDALQHTRLRLGEGYAGRAALERKLICIPDLRGRKTDFLRSPYFSAEGFVAYYAVPLIAKGQVKGVLEVFHRAPLAAGPDWVSFLETLAGQAAIAIDNAQLFDNLQRSNVDLALAYDATIEGWSHALDLRDKETEGHTQRVTEMTLRLARAMGITDEELAHVRRGALLHDIGKMGVPDNILLKPGPLTEEEWAIMRQHPTHAFEMLAPIDYLRRALDIPYCHHEKWDGAGYPRGLKGEQIPLAARIFAVVDVWDALRSDRPYRAGWPEEQVREYIREQAGKHFDPAVAEMFLRELIQ